VKNKSEHYKQQIQLAKQRLLVYRKLFYCQAPYIQCNRYRGGYKGGRGTFARERIKCLIFDSEMCTLQKVGGKDSKGRRVL